jgi:tetratricopeptide (TPR) repeat protein
MSPEAKGAVTKKFNHNEPRVRRSFFLFCFLFFFSGFFSFAQQQNPRPWWYTLEQGKFYFRGGEYGKALLSFEDARRQRRAVYDRMERDFIDFLSMPEVRRLDDSLDLAEKYAAERNYANVSALLAELYYRVPGESFSNSAAAALSVLGTLKDYPEAEYWIGETYRMEGELGLALSQFRKAYELRGLFENPGSDLDLLYKIADIRRIRQEYNEMERTLLLILERDALWSEESGSFAKNAMIRTLENEGADRFLNLYRYDNTAVEAAHRLLGFYYYASGRHSRAEEHLLFAFLIQNTIIIEELILRDYDYTFTGLRTLSGEINRNSLLSDYVSKTEYYRTAYYLGTSLFGAGRPGSARALWNFLAATGEAGEWQNRALAQLSGPRVDRAVEMP